MVQKGLEKCGDERCFIGRRVVSCSWHIAMYQILNLTGTPKFRSTHKVDLRVLTRNYDSKECRTVFLCFNKFAV